VPVFIGPHHLADDPEFVCIPESEVTDTALYQRLRSKAAELGVPFYVVSDDTYAELRGEKPASAPLPESGYQIVEPGVLEDADGSKFVAISSSCSHSEYQAGR
jgi:hypothetical protein